MQSVRDGCGSNTNQCDTQTLTFEQDVGCQAATADGGVRSGGRCAGHAGLSRDYGAHVSAPVAARCERRLQFLSHQGRRSTRAAGLTFSRIGGGSRAREGEASRCRTSVRRGRDAHAKLATQQACLPQAPSVVSWKINGGFRFCLQGVREPSHQLTTPANDEAWTRGQRRG